MYEWGWGESFHFGRRSAGEAHKASLSRSEYLLAASIVGQDALRTDEPLRLLDVGCGIGGPARAVGRFLNMPDGPTVTVDGITLNEYQVKRGNALNKAAGLDDVVTLHQGNFCDMDFDDESFDAAYTIEAACHAPRRIDVFVEINRVLRMGGTLGAYEWLLTDTFDPDNEEHQRIKLEICVGNGLPDIESVESCNAAFEACGFEIERCTNLAEETPSHPVSWFHELVSVDIFHNFWSTAVGHVAATTLLYVMETLRLVPKGSLKTQQMLKIGGDALCVGAVAGIFTPMQFYLVRKVKDVTLAEAERAYDSAMRRAAVAAKKATKTSSSKKATGGSRARGRSPARK